MLDVNSIFHNFPLKVAKATNRIAAMAIECCSTLSIAVALCESLTASEAIRLYRVCPAIYNGNQMHRELWQHMESTINIFTQPLIPTYQATVSEHHQTRGETNALPIAT